MQQLKRKTYIRHIKRKWLARLWWRVKFAALSIWPNRLACPVCHKIGTFYPHDPPPRYLCKWCGLYEDIRRVGYARPCNKMRVWMLRPIKPGLRPCERIGRLDPWRH